MTNPAHLGHEEFLQAGWVPNPSGVSQVVKSLWHDGRLAAAAPSWMGDGLEGDLMPYLAYYESENDWGGDKEPPYLPQPGNDCTAEALARINDLLLVIESLSTDAPQPRTCIEASYAFGLFKAGLTGDNGCYGAAMARAALEIGLISYRDLVDSDIGDEVSAARLQKFANNPQAILNKYKSTANESQMGEIFLISTWEEYCGAIANSALVTVASGVGYATPRDEKGICRRRSKWMHQLGAAGVIRSDGVETAVILQSWGRNNPTGPTPFNLPSFAFRALREDFESQLRAGDTWGFRHPKAFDKSPLPDKYTNAGWAS